MRIELRCEGFSAPAGLEEQVRRRIGPALRKFRDRIQWVRVRLADVNGPKGGADKACTVQLRFKGRSDVIQHDKAGDARVAIDRAISGALRTLSRQADRVKRIGRVRREVAAPVLLAAGVPL